jgi:periplasmic protein TonB
MKFKNSKFITGGIMAFVICSSMAACSGDESTKKPMEENKPSDSAGTTESSAPGKDTTAVRKKRGRATIGTVATTDANTKMEKDKTGYYNYTEVLPAYVGGQGALDSYINSNIEYPQQAIDNSIEGTVNVQFAVDEQGAVSNVSVIGTKAGYGLDEEAVRVVSKMPKWSPGQIKGKNVKTWRVLPITYKFES